MSELFQRFGRPILKITAVGCFGISVVNYTWEFHLKISYFQWNVEQHQFLQILQVIDPTKQSAIKTIETPSLGFSTSSEKIYRLGLHFLTQKDAYERESQELYHSIELQLHLPSSTTTVNTPNTLPEAEKTAKPPMSTTITATATGNKREEAKDERIQDLQDDALKMILLKDLQNKYEKEQSSRTTFLEQVQSPPSILIDPETKRYRYKPFLILKIGAICQILPILGKRFGAIVSIALVGVILLDFDMFLPKED